MPSVTMREKLSWFSRKLEMLCKNREIGSFHKKLLSLRRGLMLPTKFFSLKKVCAQNLKKD